LLDLARHDFTGMSPELRANLLAFYRDAKPAVGNGNKADQKAWADTLAALEKLRAVRAAG
jgi:hypothetical protein